MVDFVMGYIFYMFITTKPQAVDLFPKCLMSYQDQKTSKSGTALHEVHGQWPYSLCVEITDLSYKQCGRHWRGRIGVNDILTLTWTNTAAIIHDNLSL